MKWSASTPLVLLTSLTALMALAEEVASKNKNGRGRGSKWWGIAKSGEPNNLLPYSPGLESPVMNSLRKKQNRLVREHRDVLSAIARGANQAILECQFQFRHRRWNCTTKNFLRGKNLFGKIVDKGCRETAFIYAITSAGVTHSVARACSEGSIQSCTCDYSHQAGARGSNMIVQHHHRRHPGNTGPPSSKSMVAQDWEWGGCSDNIDWGFKFSRAFVDTGERGRNLREKMNLHNNEAGRAHVRAGMYKDCKCHGMSGACTLRTCWMRLPNFRHVGDSLKDRFDGASRVMVSNDGSSRRQKNRYNFKLQPFDREHKPPELEDLVYYEKSPEFCERNPRMGIQGTHGRLCNDTSIGVDGCELMCCGRGHRSQQVVVRERCKCYFKWCCEVKCEICLTNKTIYTCL